MVSDTVAAMSRTPMISDVTTLAHHIAEVRRTAAEMRGEDAQVTVQVQTPASDVLLRNGSLEEHCEHLGKLADAGVDQFMLDLPGSSAAQTLEQIQRYAEEVIAPLTIRPTGDAAR